MDMPRSSSLDPLPQQFRVVTTDDAEVVGQVICSQAVQQEPNSTTPLQKTDPLPVYYQSTPVLVGWPFVLGSLIPPSVHLLPEIHWTFPRGMLFMRINASSCVLYYFTYSQLNSLLLLDYATTC